MPTCRKAMDLYISSLTCLSSKPQICVIFLLFCQNYASKVPTWTERSIVQYDICIVFDTVNYRLIWTTSGRVESLHRDWFLTGGGAVLFCAECTFAVISMCLYYSNLGQKEGYWWYFLPVGWVQHASKLYLKCTENALWQRRGHTKCQQSHGWQK